jgi:hypothetical protein
VEGQQRALGLLGREFFVARAGQLLAGVPMLEEVLLAAQVVPDDLPPFVAVAAALVVGRGGLGRGGRGVAVVVGQQGRGVVRQSLELAAKSRGLSLGGGGLVGLCLELLAEVLESVGLGLGLANTGSGRVANSLAAQVSLLLHLLLQASGRLLELLLVVLGQLLVMIRVRLARVIRSIDRSVARTL